MNKRSYLLPYSLFILLAAAIFVASVGQAVSETKRGLNVVLTMSKPANGSFYVAGEKAAVGITLKDSAGKDLNMADFETLGLYMYGPQEPSKTVTTVKLLKASTNRSKRPHHYIDLLTNKSANFNHSTAGQSGNFVSFPLQAVTDEEPGTYTASLRVVKKGNPPVNQAFFLTDFQIKTATVEKQVVDQEKCAACHRGAASGQLYMHHVDPRPNRSAFGSPAIDSEPVRTCKSCHNNDGYAAYRLPDDPKVRVSDTIVYRVHGVHNGINLKNPKNTDHKKGLFRHYTHVIFPANPKDCTTCHVDDRWKTKPSEAACGACHDNTWYGSTAAMPKGMESHIPAIKKNRTCESCHTADKTGKGLAPISVSHNVDQRLNQVAISLSPAKNGKFYVAGEKPVVTLVIKDNSGKPIADHTKVAAAAFKGANLFVYGPRRNAKPVLTTVAKNGTLKLHASASNYIKAEGSRTKKGWTFKEGDTFKIAVNNGPVQELKAPAGFQTPAQVRDWLAKNLKGVTVKAVKNTTINIRSNIDGKNSKIAIYNSPVTKIMGWKRGGEAMARGGKTPGMTAEPLVAVGRASYQINDIRKQKNPRDEDPKATRNAGNITYQLDDVKDVGPGTYTVFAWVEPARVAEGEAKDPNFSQSALGLMTFQVGRAEPDREVATNCKDCHRQNIWHYDQADGIAKPGGHPHPAPFDPDACKACHDYGRYNTGNGFDRTGGDSTNGWSGYGAVPLSRRIHQLHFGKYLSYPEEIYAGNPNLFSEAIFPQDVRNCIKCHSGDTTGTWKTEPSRLACMSCHDSKSANAHAQLQTLNRNPDEQWDPGRVETCKVCHGAGREFSVEKSHNITDPFRPPYFRAGLGH